MGEVENRQFPTIITLIPCPLTNPSKPSQLPDNLVSCPDLLTACLDATLLIFVMPFQFLKPLLPTVRKVMDPEARGVSLIKEVHFDEETLGVKLISKQIQDGLSFKKVRELLVVTSLLAAPRFNTNVVAFRSSGSATPRHRCYELFLGNRRPRTQVPLRRPHGC